MSLPEPSLSGDAVASAACDHQVRPGQQALLYLGIVRVPDAGGHHGNELRVHLFDRGEWTLSFKRSLRVFSPEGGDALPLDPGGARAAFREVVQEYVDEVRGGVVRVGGHYVLAATDAPLDEVLRAAITGARLEVGTWA